MSTPLNPLAKFTNYNVKYVLAAYRYTEDAERTVLSNTSGKTGETVKNIPKSMIIINEFNSDYFLIRNMSWGWKKRSVSGGTATQMDGSIEIADRVSGQFVDWFNRVLIPTIGISAQHITFALQTYFIGTDGASNEIYSPTERIITGQRLLFNIHELDEIFNTKYGTVYDLRFTAAYNTTGQIVQLKPYQMTLTHKDGNLNNSDPEVFGASSGLQPRSSEDSKNGSRDERLAISQPMTNLKDIFDAFEVELNQQTVVNKRQVQKWLEQIRNGYVTKIFDPVQERGDKLPINFKVELDSAYYNYPVDSRNLPFEQTDEDMSVPGIVSYTTRFGADFIEIVNSLMRLSSRSAADSARTPAIGHKTNVSYKYEKNETLTITIKIKRITTPLNSSFDVDTGPGESAVKEGPLEFIFKSNVNNDPDVIYVKTNINSDSGVVPVEIGIPSPVFGNREPTMGERAPFTASGTQYFKSGFSGLRVPLSQSINAGLEQNVVGAELTIGSAISQDQKTDHEMEIMGNPYLMFDLQRYPSQAESLSDPGNPNYYQIPESYPLYIKLIINMRSEAVLGLTVDETVPPSYYYEGYYEVIGVINNLSSRGGFTQFLSLSRTDNIV